MPGAPPLSSYLIFYQFQPPLPDIQTGSVALRTNCDEKTQVSPLDPKQLTLALQAEQEALVQ